MQLARVTGTVVASTKVPGMEGVKLLIIQPLDRHQRPRGKPVVAADAVHRAGPGELVYFALGKLRHQPGFQQQAAVGKNDFGIPVMKRQDHG